MAEIYSNQELARDPRPIEKVFFDSMLNGYVSKRPLKTTDKGIPGSKLIKYRDGHWRVLDTYSTTKESGYSGGTTYIFYFATLVWMMQYWGMYPEHLTPLLKEALRTTYEKRVFYGGRGPKEYDFPKAQGLRYKNHVVDSRFTHFHGEETIAPRLEEDDINFGFHRYHGGLIIRA